MPNLILLFPSAEKRRKSHFQACFGLAKEENLSVRKGGALRTYLSWHMLLLSGQVWSDSFMTPWSVAHQVPLSMGSPRPEYWSGVPFPSPGDLPDPGVEPMSPASQADALLPEPPGQPVSHRVVFALGTPDIQNDKGRRWEGRAREQESWEGSY